MTHNYNAKINYYSFLSGKPRAWQLIFPVSTVIAKDDTVNVIEVDSGGTPTGNTMTGTVVYVSTEVVYRFLEPSKLIYVIPD